MGAGDTHNQVGDVHGPVVQAQHIDNITFNVSGSTIGSRIPREVPAVIGRFINRDLDFEQVDLRLPADAQTVEIGLVNGTPGVGTSWFARRYAQLNVERFAGGQLHADFAGSAVAPGDVLTRFLI
jgi:hypothetical protein